MTTWQTVDEPVLRWLAAQRSSFMQPWQLQLTLRPEPEQSEEMPGLDSRQIDEALLRLETHGLIAGHRDETIGFSLWNRLRLTGLGLQVLGEWPELDRLSSAAGLQLLLARLAEESDSDEERSRLRQLVGFLAQVGDGVVQQTMNEVAAAGVEEARDEL